ncbi:MAG: histidine kinase [Bacteroidia bacterium]|nr:histidine kinase [Bacteroidia bacterium]
MNKRIPVALCFLSIFLTFPLLRAQEPSFRQFTVKDGLPSMTAYHIQQDHLGHLWISTDNGLSRYDGYRFHNWRMADGLPDKEILGSFEDPEGRIWLLPFNGRLAYVEDGKVIPRQAVPWVPRINGIPLFSCILPDHRVVVGTYNGIIAFDETHLDTIFGGYGGFKKLLVSARGEPRFILTDGTAIGYDPVRRETHTLARYSRLSQGWHYFFRPHDSRAMTPDELETFAADSAGMGASIRQVRKATPGTEILNALRGPDQTYWVGTKGQGLFRYDHSRRSLQRFLQNATIGKIMYDRGGNLWVSTLGNGLFFLPEKGLEILTYRTSSGLPGEQVISLAAGRPGEIFWGYESTLIGRRSKNGQISHFSPQSSTLNGIRVTDLEMDRWGNLICSTDLGSYLLDTSALPSHAPVLTSYQREKINGTYQSTALLSPAQTRFRHLFPDPCKGQLAVSDSLILFALGRSMSQSLKRKEDIFSENILFKPVYTLAHDFGENQIVFGTLDSLFYYDLPSHQPHPVAFQDSLKSRVSCLHSAPGSGLWIGTAGNGVFYHQGTRLTHFTEINGLPSNAITSIFAGRDGQCWVGTDRGLARIDLTSGDSNSSRIQIINASRGLFDDYINDVIQHGDTVWIATPGGLSFFNPQTLSPRTSLPEVSISRVAIRGRDTLVQTAYQLAYWQNSISIYLHDPNFAAAGYQYRFSQQDSNWVELSEPVAYFPLLAAGQDYEVEVRARNRAGEWGPSRIIRFSIGQQFFKTTWFLLLSLILGAGIILLIASVRRRSRERFAQQQQQYTRDLVKLRLTALKYQMNPHFLFNSLNSIQHLIIENDERTATIFVAKFARLVRMVVDNSQSDFISLQQELEVCKIYLELESIRLVDNFNFEIKVDPALKTNALQIPTMLLQPFLENAIWHGLMPKKEDRRLLMEVTAEPDSICFVVEDNGIGRNAARALRAGKHQSQAVNNFSERIDLLKRTFGQHAFGMTYTDLLDDRQQPCGTRVAIRFPKMNHDHPLT